MPNYFHLTVYNSDGTIADERYETNFVTTLGKQRILTSLYADGDFGYIGWMGFGNGTGITSASTNLAASYGRLSTSGPTIDSYGKAIYYCTISTNAGTTWDNKNYKEAGLFWNTTTAATMYAGVTFSEVTKTADQYFRVTWSVTFSG